MASAEARGAPRQRALRIFFEGADAALASTLADEGARAFAAALKRNRVLTALDLSANGISEAGGTEILKALRRGKHSVVSCALGDNLLPEWMLAAADAACLSVALPARLKKAAPPAQHELVEARLLPSHAALLHDHAAVDAARRGSRKRAREDGRRGRARGHQGGCHHCRGLATPGERGAEVAPVPPLARTRRWPQVN